MLDNVYLVLFFNIISSSSKPILIKSINSLHKLINKKLYKLDLLYIDKLNSDIVEKIILLIISFLSFFTNSKIV